VVARGEGSYFYDVEGRKYLDFNSQAMCSNLGHTVPLFPSHSLTISHSLTLSHTHTHSHSYLHRALVVARGEGSYFYDVEGRKYLDFNSQAMCSNLGHTVPQPVIDEINAQLRTIAYTYPCATVTPIKAKLSALLADLLPGDLNHLYYTAGGAESNETAMRMARLRTGRYKVFTPFPY
jgi:taurine--2-oxoglutarate transaminase